MPIILVQNERTAGARFDFFENVTGERYHFLNRYLPRIVSGTEFVYYRGTRRHVGRRHVPEYFGYGRIGPIWRDPRTAGVTAKRDRRWFCAIEDFTPFPRPVPWRVDGKPLESIASNQYQVSVRPISEEQLLSIVSLGGLGSVSTSAGTTLLPEMPALDSLLIRDAEDLWDRPVGAAGNIGVPRLRRSAHAKATGDRAEAVVHHYLRSRLEAQGARSLRWVADAGETPGWDIEYVDQTGALIAVEVKGTSGRTFRDVELTAGEWRAAAALGERYWLYLVADCLSGAPAIQAIQDPYGRVAGRSMQIEPLVWRLSLV